MKFTSTPYLVNFGKNAREKLRGSPSCPNYFVQKDRGPHAQPTYSGDRYQTEPLKFKYHKIRRKRRAKCHIPLQTVSCPQRLEKMAQPTIRQVANNLNKFGPRWDTDRFEKTLELYHKISIPYWQSQLHAYSQPTLPSYNPHSPKRKKKPKTCLKPSKSKKMGRGDDWLTKFTYKMASSLIEHVLLYNRPPNHRHLKLGLKLNAILRFGEMFHVHKLVRTELERYCVLMAQVVDNVCRPYQQKLRLTESASSEGFSKEDKHCVFNLRNYNAEMNADEIEIIEEDDFSFYSLYEDTAQNTVPYESSSEEMFTEPPPSYTRKRTHYIRTIKVTESLIEGIDKFLDVYVEVPMSPPQSANPIKIRKILYKIYDSGLQEQFYFEQHGPRGRVRKHTIDAHGNTTVSYHHYPSRTKQGYALVEEETHTLHINGVDIPLQIQRYQIYEKAETGPFFDEEHELMGIAGEAILESEAETESLFDDDTDLTCNWMMPLPKVKEEHDKDAVSYVEICLYMSWLNEFGNNISGYKNCLMKFKSILMAEDNAQYVGTIARILKNWGNYLKDSRMVEKSMAEYFRNKKIQKCCRCRKCCIDDIPGDHDIPKELRLAIRTTKIWRSLLYDAEVYCKTLKGAEDEMDEDEAEAEENEKYVQILDVSSGTSEYEVIDMANSKH